MGNISLDATKVKALSENFDSHCLHSPTYFPRIEEILGKNDGSLAWNKAYKAATFTNPELDKLRAASKPISFSLAYGAGLTGLFRSVGYMGKTFDDDIRFRDYSYTMDIEERTDKSGKTYKVPSFSALWLDVEIYEHLDTKYHEFFKQAVIPSKHMHFKYHNTLYPGLAIYQSEAILAQAKQYKNVHGMLGLHINQTKRMNNGSKRTLTNFQYQSGSMMTLIGMEKTRRKLREHNLHNDVFPHVSIYDSVYYTVRKDANIIKRFADMTKPIMEEPFIVDQKIPLISDLEISLDNWANFTALDKIDNLEKYLKG